MKKYKMAPWAIGESTYQWICDNIPHGSTILEFGSGSGSSALGNIFDMHCVEHDPNWLNKFDNITYYFAKIIDGWYDPSVLDKLPINYSLLIIDGPPGHIGRLKIKNYIDRFDDEVPFVVDDTHRRAEYDLAKEIERQTGKSPTEIKDTYGKKSIILL